MINLKMGKILEFSKEDTKMTNKYMKRFSTPLVIRGMHSKMVMSYHFTFMRCDLYKKSKNNKC